MKAIIYQHIGGPEVLQIKDIPIPEISPEQLLVNVKACALNRADILQRQGKYPAPSGESDVLGLELAGEVVKIGSRTSGFNIRDRVFGLVGSGAYAEYCVIDYKMAMLIPEKLNYQEAAAIPEAFLTANEALFTLGDLNTHQSVLIHAGASGVSTAAVQLAHQNNCKVFITASQQEKIQHVLELGADVGINYKTDDFSEMIFQIEKAGVDVILDFIGANYLMKNIKSLKQGGRLIEIATMGGRHAEIDLLEVIRKRLQIKGLIMRTQSIEKKREITKRFYDRWYAALSIGKIKPVIDSVYSVNEVQLTHKRMESNLNIGKIVLVFE